MAAATPALTASFARTVRLRPNGVTQRMVSMPPRRSMANSPEKQIAQASPANSASCTSAWPVKPNSSLYPLSYTSQAPGCSFKYELIFCCITFR